MSLVVATSRLGRLVELVGWTAVAVMVVLVVTEIVGWTGNKHLAALQALAPYVLGLAFPLTAAAVVSQRWALGALAGAVAAVLVVMSWPLLHPPAQPAVADGATPLRVFHANLLYLNSRYDDVAAAVGDVDADVLAFSEYTPEAAAALHSSPVAREYPYRIERPEPDAAGAAMWSRFPLTELDAPATRSHAVVARVDAPQPIVVSAVHVTSPLVSTTDWSAEMGRMAPGEIGHEDEPVVMVGDFNAAYWHPRFRRLLEQGWTDAHQALGRGFSASWPADRRVLPNFVRIDHALVNDRAVATSIDDVHVPGSDHVGFVVTVVPAA